MRVRLWGTRGSLPCPGAETMVYGGNTSCVEVQGSLGTLLVLDAGTGIRRLGATLPASLSRVDILLTHLHLDHIEGLGFFAPLYTPHTEVHIWGPASTMQTLSNRLSRYLSPPLFPVHLRELPNLTLHDLPFETFQLGEFQITVGLVCHPGPTVGYRITTADATLAYLPDHEPVLGTRTFPGEKAWTSGYTIAYQADLLIHDAQYTHEEYDTHIGWGHSSWDQALQFAELTEAKRLIAWHHDPLRSDEALERLAAETLTQMQPNFAVIPGREGDTFILGRSDFPR